MKKYPLLKFVFLAFLVIGTVYILAFRSTPKLHTAQGHIYGTTYSVSYLADHPLDSLILKKLRSVDSSLSMFNPHSIVSQVNRSENPVVDQNFISVFNLSNAVSEATGGDFDVTVAPLVNLWGFGFKRADSVTDQAIDSLLPLVDYRRVRLDGKHVVKADDRMMLDFSSVAKGYGVDLAAMMLEREGVTDYMIEVGGEVRVSGHHPEGRAWRIGITRPTVGREQEEQVQATISLTSGAMATSGNYRRYYVKNGRRYAHTIHPRTGRPVSHSLLSATVIAPTCAMADAYATAFMVMGVEKAKEVLKQHKELNAYFIIDGGDDTYQTWQTPGFPATQ